MSKHKEYIINPSALSYLCNHCAYMRQNFNLYNDTISAGITQTLDGIEKDIDQARVEGRIDFSS